MDRDARRMSGASSSPQRSGRKTGGHPKPGSQKSSGKQGGSGPRKLSPKMQRRRTQKKVKLKERQRREEHAVAAANRVVRLPVEPLQEVFDAEEVFFAEEEFDAEEVLLDVAKESLEEVVHVSVAVMVAGELISVSMPLHEAREMGMVL